MMKDDDRMAIENFDDAALARVLDTTAPIEADDKFRANLLSAFDDFQRRRRNGGLAGFAEAIGWRPFGRPWAPAGLATMLVAVGFLTGAATANAGAADDEAFASFAAAYNQTLAVTSETPSWVEE